ncbi:MAG: zf-TFIIB domain-containing protein [Pseudomonadota bacterium]
MISKPSDSEQEYFARQDAEARRKMAVEKARAILEEERQRLKQLHFMRCPKCGLDLDTINFQGVAIERCFGCNGSWLDEGELESLASCTSKEQGFLNKVIGIFKAGAP